MNEIISSVGKSLTKHSPTILSGLGIAGFVGAILFAIEAAPAAEYDLYGTEDYALKERLKIALPHYAPTIAMATLSATAIILSNRIHLRRTAAVVSMYHIVENSLQTYQSRVMEIMGQRKEQAMRNDINDEKIDLNPPDERNIFNVGGGMDLVYDILTGRYFWSDAEKIRAAVNSYNHELLSENVKTLNELYYDFGLPSVELGNSFGWESDSGLVEVAISAKIAHGDEKPCLIVDFVNRPKFLWE